MAENQISFTLACVTAWMFSSNIHVHASLLREEAQPQNNLGFWTPAFHLLPEVQPSVTERVSSSSLADGPQDPPVWMISTEMIM